MFNLFGPRRSMLDTVSAVNQSETDHLMKQVEAIPFGTDEEKADAMFGSIVELDKAAGQVFALGIKGDVPEVAQIGAITIALLMLMKEQDGQALNAVAEIVQQAAIYHSSKRKNN